MDRRKNILLSYHLNVHWDDHKYEICSEIRTNSSTSYRIPHLFIRLLNACSRLEITLWVIIWCSNITINERFDICKKIKILQGNAKDMLVQKRTLTRFGNKNLPLYIALILSTFVTSVNGYDCKSRFRFLFIVWRIYHETHGKSRFFP